MQRILFLAEFLNTIIKEEQHETVKISDDNMQKQEGDGYPMSQDKQKSEKPVGIQTTQAYCEQLVIEELLQASPEVMDAADPVAHIYDYINFQKDLPRHTVDLLAKDKELQDILEFYIGEAYQKKEKEMKADKESLFQKLHHLYRGKAQSLRDALQTSLLPLYAQPVMAGSALFAIDDEQQSVRIRIEPMKHAAEIHLSYGATVQIDFSTNGKQKTELHVVVEGKQEERESAGPNISIQLKREDDFILVSDNERGRHDERGAEG